MRGPLLAVVVALAGVVPTAHPKAAMAGPPPQALPEGASFGSYGISFGSYGISFGSYGISFGSTGLSDEMRTLAASREPETDAEPPPEPEPLAEGLAVTEEDGGVRYTLAADILFDFDSDALRPASQAALAALSQDVRQRFEAPAIVVEGHTDSRGSDAYNQTLSERRAEAVEAFLSEAEGFSAEAIDTRGLGEAQPAVPNKTPDGVDDPEGRQANRRVEVLVRPAS